MIVPRYGPGRWLAVVTDGHVCLLPPDTDVDTVTALWAAVREGAGLTAQLQLLLAGGLEALPPFALVALERDRVHVVVRGDVEVQVDGAEPTTLTGRHVATWHEAVVEGARAVLARVLDGAEGIDARLPALSAVVHADVVAVELRPVARRGTPAAPSRTEPTAPARTETADPPVTAAAPAPAPAPTSVGPHALEDLEHTLLHAATDTSVGLPVWPATGAPSERPARARPEPAREVPSPSRPEPGPAPEPATAQQSDEVEQPDQQPEQPQRATAAPAHPVPVTPDEPSPAPVLVPAATPDDADHDGTTVLSSDVVDLRRQLPEWAGEGVPGPLAVPAPNRPAPAKIRLSSGLVVALTRPVLLGRAPQVSRVSNREMPRLVTVASPRQDISRTHAEVRLDGEDVLVTDLRSTNGVLLLRPGHGPQRLHPGEPTVVEPGVQVDLGEGVTFVVERGA